MTQKRIIKSLTSILITCLMLLPVLLMADGEIRPHHRSIMHDHPYEWYFMPVTNDTLQPPFATHACDLVCPDFQVNWGTSSANCGESNGFAQVMPVGFPEGTTFNYEWSGGISTTNTASGLAAGVYTVTVSVNESGNGSFRNCDVIVEVLVDNIDGPELDISNKPADCLTQNGKAYLEINSGTPPFNISWNNGSATSNNLGEITINGLAAGEYIFTVEDANGCISSIKETIDASNNGIFDVLLSKTDPTACGLSDGTLTVTINGGFPPYLIQLNNGTSAPVSTNTNTFTFTGLSSGLYKIDVTDSYLCSEVDQTIALSVDCPPSIDGWIAVDADCSDGLGYLEFDGSGSPNEYFEIRQLESVFVITTVNGAASTIIEVPLGTYRIKRVSNLDECICEIALDVTAPDPIEVKVESVDEGCGPDGIPDGMGRITVTEVNGGTAPYTILVTGPDATVYDISASMEITGLSAGSYEINITDANNCAPLIFTDTIAGPAVIESGLLDTITVCAGAPYQINGDDNLQYNWSPSAGLNDATIADPVITVGSDMIYIVTITDPAGGACNTTVDTLQVIVEPTIDLLIINDTIPCENTSVMVEALTNSESLIDSILWYDENNQLINQGSEFELTTAEADDTFLVIAQSANGCVDSANFVLTALPPSDIDIFALPQDTIICEGATVTFEAVTIPAVNNLEVNWHNADDGSLIETAFTLSVSPAVGTYSYLAILEAGICSNPDTAIVNLEVINEPAPPFPVDTTMKICVGDTIRFDVEPYSLSYQWKDIAGNVIVEDGALEVEATTAGTVEYIFMSMSACGMVSDTLEVEVFDAGQLEIIPDSTIVLCAPADTVCLSVDFAAPECLVWTDLAGNELGSGSELCVLPPLGESQYIVSVPTLSCIENDTATIIVIDEPQPPFPVDTTMKVCVGDTIRFDVEPYPLSYQWKDIDGNVIIEDGALEVEATTAGTVEYIFMSMSACGMVSDTLEVQVFGPEQLEIIPDSTIVLCAPADTVCLSVDFAAPECLVWTDLAGNELGSGSELCVLPPLGESQYIVSVPTLSCIENDTATIIVIDEPAPPFPVDTTMKVCIGDTIFLDIEPYPLSYQWKDIAGNVIIEDGALEVEATTAGTIEYIFMSMSACGMVSDTLEVQVFGPEQLEIIPDSTIVLCAPADTVCLSVDFAAPECLVWTDLAGNELGSGSELCVLPPLGESQYIVSVPTLSCIENDTATIIVIDEPAPPFPVDTTMKVCIGDTIFLDIEPYPLSYQWKDIAGNVIIEDGALEVEATTAGTIEYIFMSMSACGMVSDTLEVQVFGPEQLEIIPDSTIVLCAPADTVCLSVDFAAPECLVWTDLAGNELGSGSELCVLPPLGESQYIVSVPTLSCIENDTATIIVIDEPQPPFPVDTTMKVCVGDTIRFDVEPYPLSYQWKDIAGNVIIEDGALEVEATTAGTVEYIFMSMSACGMVSDTLEVQVFDAGQLEIIPDSTIVLCAPADTVCLSVDFAAPECLVWTDLAGNELGSGSQLCVLPPLGESQYIVSVPTLSCIESDTATIIVIDEPQPPFPVDTTMKVCVGDTIRFDVEPYPLSYQWKDIAGNVIIEDGALEVEATTAGTVEYIFMSMSACGMVSDTLEVQVFDAGQLEIIQDSTIVLCAPADTVCLSVDFAAPECLVWTDLAGNELGSGSELCVLPPLGESQYIVSVPTLSCIESDTATIIVIDEPAPPFPVDTTMKVCVGDTIRFDVEPYPLSYQWKDIAGNVIIEDGALEVEATTAGTVEYIFMSMSACGMVSDTLEVQVFGPEQLEIIPDSTIVLCAPADTVCLSVDFAAPECLVWTDLAGNELGSGSELCVLPPLGESQYIVSVPTLSCIENDTATIIVIDEPAPPFPVDTTMKVCVGDTIRFDVEPYPLSYQWKDIAGNVIIEDGALEVEATTAGTIEYIFMSMSACGMVSDTLEVQVFDAGQLEIIPDSTIVLCAPADTVCLSVDFAAPECLVWTDLAGNELGSGSELCVLPPLGESQYIVSVPTLSCIESDTATIIVIDEPAPPFPVDTTMKVCVGDTIRFDVEPYPLSYQWKDIAGNVIIEDGALEVEATTAGTIEYIFMSMSACGMVSDTLEVQVFGPEQLEIIPDSTIVLCAPADTVCLSVDFAAPECLVWTDLAGNELGSGSELCVLPPLGESQYIVSVPTLSCIENDTATIIVIDEPAPPFPVDTTMKVCVGDTIRFDVEPYPLSYQWKDIAGNVIIEDGALEVEATIAGTIEYIFMSMSACGMVSDTLEVQVFDAGQLEIIPDSTIVLCAPADTVCLSVDFAAPECLVWTDLAGNELGSGSELCVLPPLGESQYIVSVPTLSCIESDTATIIVIDEPQPPFPVDTTMKVCVGDTIRFDVEPYPLSYQWKDIDGNVIIEDGALEVEATTAGTVEYIFMSMSACGMVSDTLEVQVFDAGQLEIIPDSTIVLCAPADTVCLSVDFAAPECLVWTDLAGNELGSGSQLCVLPPLGESQYIVSVPTLSCIESDTATIIVIDEPQPPFPVDTTMKVCVGDTIRFDVEPYPLSYQWKDIAGNVIIEDGALEVEATTAGTVEYIFMSMSACGMVSDTLEVQVFDAGQLEIIPDSTIVLCAPADTVCLSVDFAAPECLVWTDLAGNELGSGSELCVLPPLGESQYIVSVPTLSCIESDTATIIVINEPAPPFPVDTTMKVCVGDTIRFDVEPYPLSYQWKDIAGNVIIEDGALEVEATTAGTIEYIFMSMSACGMVSDTLEVQVFDAGQLEIIPDSTIVLCAPADTVCLSVDFAAPECLVWTDLAGNELGSGSELCVLPPLGESQYIVSVPTLSCIESDTATIIVIDEPAPPFPVDTTMKVCVGDTIRFDVEPYPLSYQWKDIAGNVIIEDGALEVEATTAGTIEYIFMSMSACGMVSDTLEVQVFDAGQLEIIPDSTIVLCAPADTVCLSVDFAAPECLVWTDLAGNELGSGSELCVLPPLGESQYIVSVPTLSCIENDTATIIVIDEPAPPFPVDTTMKVCVGDTIRFDVEPYPLSYQWKDIAGNVIVEDGALEVEATTAGTVEYIFMSMSACGMVSDTLEVQVFGPEQLEIIPDSTIVLCAPADTVCLSVDFAAPECLVWTDLAGNELGSGSELCVLPPLGESQYIVSVPTLSCIESDTATIIVIDEPQPPFPVDTTMKVCVGDTIRFDVEPYPLSYQWKDIDGNVIIEDGALEVEATTAGTVEYIFMSMSACGMVSDTLEVQVFGPEQLEIIPDSTIVLCAPADTVCLSVDFAAPECLVWTDLAGNELGSGSELCVLPPLGESQYIVSVPTLSCIENDTATIIVIDEPASPFPVDTTMKVCIGDTIFLDIEPYPLSYQWKDIAGNVIIEDGALEVEATTAGTIEYIFMSMSACGMVSDTLEVQVFDAGQLEIIQDSTIVLCAPADTVCLSADFAAPECLVWTDLAGNELGSGSELCVLPPLGESQYIVSVPTLSCIENDTATIIVIDEPAPPFPVDTTLKVCVGDTIFLDVEPYPLSYQWKDIAGNVIIEDGALEVEATTAGTIEYIFMSMSACGMVSDTLEVQVFDAGQLEIIPDSTIGLCAPADTVCLSVDFVAPECLVWTDLAGNELGSGSELCVLPPLGESQYIVSVPTLSCIESDTATIIVDTLPPEMILDTLLKVCVGDSIKYDIGAYPYTYQWKDIDGNVLFTDEALCVEAEEEGTQQFVFMSMNGCGMMSDTLEVEVFGPEQLEIIPDSTIVLCAPADTICLSVDFVAPECLVWTDLAGNELGTGSELCVLPPLGESQYIVSVPTLSCIENDTAIIIVDTIPPLPPFGDTTINVCIGDTAKLVVDDYPFSFEWLDEFGEVFSTSDSLCFVPTEIGSTSFIWESANGCGMASAMVTINAYDSTQLRIMPDEIIYLCAPVDTTICLEVINDSDIDTDFVVWTDLEGNQLGEGTILCVTPEEGINNYIASIPGADCVEADTATIIVIPEGLDINVTPDTTTICEGETAELVVDVMPPWTGHQTDWYEDGSLIAMGTDTLIVSPPGGSYEYMAVVSNVCTADTVFSLLDVNSFDLTISASPDTICIGETSTLSVDGCDDCIYQWTPIGSLSDPTISNPVASPEATTLYTVVVSDGNCSDTLTILVVVLPEEECSCPEAFFVATAFTPDNDGTNDQACLRSEYLDSYDRIVFMVYNRWGEEMIRVVWDRETAQGPPGYDDFCWDGYHRGVLLPPDVYGYYVELTCPGPDGKVIKQKGNITLLR